MTDKDRSQKNIGAKVNDNDKAYYDVSFDYEDAIKSSKPSRSKQDPEGAQPNRSQVGAGFGDHRQGHPEAQQDQGKRSSQTASSSPWKSFFDKWSSDRPKNFNPYKKDAQARYQARLQQSPGLRQKTGSKAGFDFDKEGLARSQASQESRNTQPDQAQIKGAKGPRKEKRTGFPASRSNGTPKPNKPSSPSRDQGQANHSPYLEKDHPEASSYKAELSRPRSSYKSPQERKLTADQRLAQRQARARRRQERIKELEGYASQDQVSASFQAKAYRSDGPPSLEDRPATDKDRSKDQTQSRKDMGAPAPRKATTKKAKEETSLRSQDKKVKEGESLSQRQVRKETDPGSQRKQDLGKKNNRARERDLSNEPVGNRKPVANSKSDSLNLTAEEAKEALNQDQPLDRLNQFSASQSFKKDRTKDDPEYIGSLEPDSPGQPDQSKKGTKESPVPANRPPQPSRLKNKQAPSDRSKSNPVHDESFDESMNDGQTAPNPPENRPWYQKLAFGFNIAFNVLSKFVLWIVLIGLLTGAFIGGVGLGYFADLVKDSEPPSQEDMQAQLSHYDQQSSLYYGDGSPIASVRTDVVRNLASLDDVSDSIIDGFIATEDEYFYDHPGIVPKAILRAGLETILSGSGTGGSTITQQLVKQQLLTDDVTFFRKANEILLALRVDKYFDKDEILTDYLNVSPFGRNNSGDNIAGISAAAQGIFGVSPKEVNLNQAAFLAGLPQDPYTYTPYDQNGQIRKDLTPGIDRMKEVLYRMYRAKKITKDDYDQAMAYDITKDFQEPQAVSPQRQSYLYQAVSNAAVEKLMRINIEKDGNSWEQVWRDDNWYNDYYFAAEEELRTGGYKVYSTIDKEIYDQLQKSAKAYEDQLGVPYEGVYTDPETGENTYYVERVQTGLVVLDNKTGRVLGFVAGTDYDNNQIDHAFAMRRSPGSTIKPMAVYGPAIEADIITPQTIIPDTAFEQVFEDGSSWAPTNYGNTMSNSFMPVRTALYRSDNIPAVKIYKALQDQGVNIFDYMKKMGFNPVDAYTEEDTQNLAFSIGGVTTGPTVFEETRAFTTFANGGNYQEGHLIDRIENGEGEIIFQETSDPVRVFSEDSNYLMIDMLRDTMTEGTGRTAKQNLKVPGDWIAKTGISENSKDIWVLASTPAITIGSWIGYDSRYQDYTIDINDGFDRESVRSQIYWAKIVNDLYGIRPEIFGSDLRFQRPDSVEETEILEDTGTLPGGLNVDGRQLKLSGPLRKSVFKKSHPAPKLSYDFMVGASEDEVHRFWSELMSKHRQSSSNHSNSDTNHEEERPEDNQANTEETSSQTETVDPASPPDNTTEDQTVDFTDNPS